MRAYHSVRRRHVPARSGLEGHVAVLADLPRRGQVEGARRVQRHAAVVPAVELVLAAQPAVVVHRLAEADLVAGCAIAALAEERLEHARGVHGRPRPDRRVVQEAPQRPRGRVREDVWAGRGVRDVVVPVPGPVVNAVDRVAGEAGQPRLRAGRSAVDLAPHLSREEEHGVVAAAAPLAGGPAHARGGDPGSCQMAVDPAVGLAGVGTHRVDRRLVERIVERRKAVCGSGPLVHDIRMAALTAATAVIPRQNALVEEPTGRGRRRGGEEGAPRRDRAGGHPSGRPEVPAQHARGVPLNTAWGLRSRTSGHRAAFAAPHRQSPVHDEQHQARCRGSTQKAPQPGLGRARMAHRPVRPVAGERQHRSRSVKPPHPAVPLAGRLREDEKPGDDQYDTGGDIGRAGQRGRVVIPPPYPRQVRDKKRRHQYGEDQPRAGVGQEKHLVEAWKARRAQREGLEADAVRQAHQKQVEGVRKHEPGQPYRDRKQSPQRRRKQGSQRPPRPALGATVQSSLRHKL